MDKIITIPFVRKDGRRFEIEEPRPFKGIDGFASRVFENGQLLNYDQLATGGNEEETFQKGLQFAKSVDR